MGGGGGLMLCGWLSVFMEGTVKAIVFKGVWLRFSIGFDMKDAALWILHSSLRNWWYDLIDTDVISWIAGNPCAGS